MSVGHCGNGCSIPCKAPCFCIVSGNCAKEYRKPCDWPKCKKTTSSMLLFCREHYLLKEANYALYDLTATDEVWYSHVQDKSPENRQWFKDQGVKRLINLAEYYLGEHNEGEDNL